MAFRTCRHTHMHWEGSALRCLNTALVSPPLSCDWTVNVAGKKWREIEAYSFDIYFPFSAHTHRTQHTNTWKHMQAHTTTPGKMQKIYLFPALLICIWKERRQYFLQPLLRHSQLLHSDLSVVYQSFTPAVNMLGSQTLNCVISLYTVHYREKMQPVLYLCAWWNQCHILKGICLRYQFVFLSQCCPIAWPVLR